MVKKQSSVKNMLKIVCIIGLVLSAIISLLLLFVSIIHVRESFEAKQTNMIRSNPFTDNLKEFDQVLAQNRFSPPVNHLDFILNSAEEHAVNVEAHLSLLKRRRILAKEIPEYRSQYGNAAVRSFEQFPYSENISIIAGEALLLNKNELDNNDKDNLSKYIKNISMRSPVIVLGFHLLEGSVRNLSTARKIPQAAEMFISSIDHTSHTEQSGLIMSGAILQILAGNKNEAVNLINKYRTILLKQPASAWFMAEALYDFDDPAAAASILGIEDYPYVNNQSIIRLSDALYRMNNINDARFFWNLLTVPEDEQQEVPRSITEKVFYNLAATSRDDEEKRMYLEALLKNSAGNVPAIIMYSRLLNHERALSLLHQTLAEQGNPLLELELIKQNRGYSEPGKSAADTWLLLGRYPANPELYQWASYFFQEMRMFDEAAQLEKNAGYNNIEDSCFVLQNALNAMRSGDLAQAENLLKSIPLHSAWEVPANLGLIKEVQLSLKEAMEYYETASSLCGNKKGQVLIQLNIARCFRAMGNYNEATRVLNYAQDIDPNNLHVRLELRRLREAE